MSAGFQILIISFLVTLLASLLGIIGSFLID